MLRRSASYLIAVAVLVIGADQFTKMLALTYLREGVGQPFLGDVVRLYLVRNDSAAFSIGFGQTWFFTLFSAIAVLVILWLGPKMRTRGWAANFGLLLGGVTGNLIDRLFREPGFPNGHVVDFLQIPFDFPVFNLADSAIVVAMSIIAIRIFRGHKIGQ